MPSKLLACRITTLLSAALPTGTVALSCCPVRRPPSLSLRRAITTPCRPPRAETPTPTCRTGATTTRRRTPPSADTRARERCGRWHRATSGRRHAATCRHAVMCRHAATCRHAVMCRHAATCRHEATCRHAGGRVHSAPPHCRVPATLRRVRLP